MIRRIALGLAALAVLGMPVTSRAQAQPDAKQAEAFKAIKEKQHELIGQCPQIPQLSAEAASRSPIHVTSWGTTGPEVVIIHGGVQGGLGGGPSTFGKQKPLGDDGFQLKVVDRPGFGESPSRGPDDMEADSVWIAGLLGNGANLIGHSFGGAEALLAAARRPAAVRSLVLIEPALQPLLFTDPSASTPEVRADNRKIFGVIMGAKTPSAYAIGFASNLGTADDGSKGTNQAAAALEANPDKATAMGCALLGAHMATPQQFRAAAEAVRAAHIPVLVVTGGWSPDFDAVGEVTAKLTGGQHVIVKSPNHFVQLANSSDFNRVAASFMRKADAEQGRTAN